VKVAACHPVLRLTRLRTAPLLAVLALTGACTFGGRPGSGGAAGQEGWPVYGGNAAGDRYSTLTQIDTRTVAGLEQAWRVDFGPGGLQTTPLVIGGVLYATTPTQQTVALSPATGQHLWAYDPG